MVGDTITEVHVFKPVRAGPVPSHESSVPSQYRFVFDDYQEGVATSGPAHRRVEQREDLGVSGVAGGEHLPEPDEY